MLKTALKGAICILIAASSLSAQINPNVFWTLLPANQMDEIIGEASNKIPESINPSVYLLWF